MRKLLKPHLEERLEFVGTFEKFGTKPAFVGFPLKTILLKNVQHKKKIVSDHCWFNYTKGFEKLGELKQGDLITFFGRVKIYEKGYKGFRNDVFDKHIHTDYKISHPTKIRKLNLI